LNNGFFVWNDTWVSADSGQSWKLRGNLGGSSGLFGFCMESTANAIVVMTGRTDHTIPHNVWRSLNGGITFVKLPSPPWRGRFMAGSSSFGSALFLVGGRSFSATFEDAYRSLDEGGKCSLGIRYTRCIMCSLVSWILLLTQGLGLLGPSVMVLSGTLTMAHGSSVTQMTVPEGALNCYPCII
jgi:hypothetical protein